MSEERPEALLKSALEKIIYFEARSEALHSDLRGAREEIGRLKGELTEASRREMELRRRLADGERVNEALRAERASLIEKIIEAARIHDSGQSGADAFDLASFIAQLRSEAIARPAREDQAPPSEAEIIASHAERLSAEGRLEVRPDEVRALSEAALRGAPDEGLFGLSARELSSEDANARLRAAERLRALGASAAAPLLAGALHRERAPEVRIALLSAFAELADGEGAAVVSPHLGADEPEVRIAALKALIALDPPSAAPHLSAAMKDPDRSVRRRASLLALGLSADVALRLGEQAASDADAQVRALGALALGAATGERARALLLEALEDCDDKVRRAAAKSLSRLFGEDVSGVAALSDVQRRREVRRLAALPARPEPPAGLAQLRNRIAARLDRPRAPEPAAREVEAPALAYAPVRPAASISPAPARAPAPAPRAAPKPNALIAPALAELRRSLKGLTVPDLSSALRAPAPAVNAALCELVQRGAAVRRGIKYFVA